MIKIYVARLPQIERNEPLLCLERQNEINSISNERVRREKYYVWKLLEYAIKNGLEKDASSIRFKKSKNGKWSCKEFEFSISHSTEAIAVAVSDESVGIDVERIRVKRSKKMAEYILTEDEYFEYSDIPDENGENYIVRKWCQKEAVFKTQNKAHFRPSEIETAEYFCVTKNFDIGEEKYILAVAAKKRQEFEIFELYDLFENR